MLRSGVLILSAVITAVACSKGAEVTPVNSTATAAAPVQATANPAPAPAPAAGATAAAPLSAVTSPVATTLASGTYSLDPSIRCDLLDVRRVSGGALLVKWRIVNTAPTQPGASLTIAEGKPVHYDFSWADLYYVDPAENKKYGYLTDSEGNRILDVWWGDLKPGEQRANWAKFPAPPTTSVKISITLPKFPPFEDVPIAQ